MPVNQQDPNMGWSKEERGISLLSILLPGATVALGTIFFHNLFLDHNLYVPAKFTSAILGSYFVKRVLWKGVEKNKDLVLDVLCIYTFLEIVCMCFPRNHLIHAAVMAAGIWFFFYYKDSMNMGEMYREPQEGDDQFEDE